MSVDTISALSNATSSSSSTSTTGGAAPASTVDYNQFLQLLIAELQNQDPTNPADPTQFMSQLASFSAVEQQVQTNSTLDALLAAQSNNIIGRTVTSADGATSGTVLSVQTSSEGAATATLDNGGQILLGSGVTVS